MKIESPDLRSVFLRGGAASLWAVVLIALMESIYLFGSGAFAHLSFAQHLEILLHFVGIFGLMGVSLGLIENLLVAGLTRLEERITRTGIRKLLLGACILAIVSPVALLAASLVRESMVEITALGIPVLVIAAMVATHRYWESTILKIADRPLALFVAAFFSLYCVFNLISAHLVIERMHSTYYFALALRYFIMLIVSCLGLAWGLFWVIRRKQDGFVNSAGRSGTGRLTAGLIVAALVSVGVYIFDLSYLRGHYPEFHFYLKIVLYVAVQMVVIRVAMMAGRFSILVLAHRLISSKPFMIAAAAFIVCGIAFAMVKFESSAQISSVCLSRGSVVGEVIKMERSLLDFDRDGYSRALGGGDCDDFDPDVNPGRREVLDNKVDDNCFGGDLTADLLKEYRQNRARMRRKSSDWWWDHPSNPKKAFNIVMITVDALRADHVGVYGYDRDTTPRIDELAGRSIVFDRAYCQGGWTSISLPGLIKGLDPSQIEFTNVYEDSYLRLWFPGEVPPDAHVLKMFTVPAFDKNESIAQILQRSGYRTVAVLNDDVTDYFQEKFGYIKGFDFYYSNNSSKITADPQLKRRTITAKRVNKVAVEELDRMPSDRPFFMWIHHFDPHGPYYDTETNIWGKNDIDYYDGEVAYADRYVGEFLDALEEKGLADNTVVIVSADHGEAFGEHGTRFHGLSGYDEEIRVPLVMHVPGMKHQWISENVGLADIVPTLLDLVGIRTEHVFSGDSLLPLIFDGPWEPDREVVSMTWRYSLSGERNDSLKTVVRGRFKLIYDEIHMHYKMFDLQADPGEVRNIADDEPERFREMKDLLMSYVERDHAGRIQLR